MQSAKDKIWSSNKNQWLENRSRFVFVLKHETWRGQNWEKKKETGKDKSFIEAEQWWNKANKGIMSRQKEIIWYDKAGEGARKRERRDINYAWKQEQQIRIEYDWQMPSCLKCFLRLVIVESVHFLRC